MKRESCPNQKRILDKKTLDLFLIFKPYIFLIFKRNILSDYKIMGVTIGALQKKI